MRIVVASSNHRLPLAPITDVWVAMMIAVKKASGGEITAVERSWRRIVAATKPLAMVKTTPVIQEGAR